jgi:4-diphosphocytidyl-2-C-methyl-D-erythritol kinase
MVQPIALFDLLEVESASVLSLIAPATSGPVEQNLVLQAARLLRDRVGGAGGAQMTLRKRIPVSAGLGGGSSDAAATLRLLSRLWRLPPGEPDLAIVAGQLGSDVPLFLSAGAALLTGRGEQVCAVPSLRTGWFVIVVPPWQEPRKTAAVYAAVAVEDFGDGHASTVVAERISSGSELDPGLLRNDLEPAARRVFPGLVGFQADLAARTAAPFVLTGAGPALFSYVADRDAAAMLARTIRPVAPTVLLARPLSGLCAIRE